MTSRVADFLLARIAEDEAAMELRGDIPHSIHSYDIAGTYNAGCPDCRGLAGTARVLAECAAKRAMLANVPTSGSDFDPLGGTSAHVLLCLASVYKDHPDYQQEWAQC